MAVYLMLSRTTTGMGSVIRSFTGSKYNHVSLTLDPKLERFVSFARYVREVPLAGGFVTEDAQRLLCEEGPLQVRIFRLELGEEREQALEQLSALADDPDSGLIYDSLGALLTTWKLRIRIPGAYTCLGFASAVLGKPFRCLQELEAYLEPFEVFCGDLRQRIGDSGDRSGAYFRHKGVVRGTGETFGHFLRLLGRILGLCRCDDPVAALFGDMDK